MQPPSRYDSYSRQSYLRDCAATSTALDTFMQKALAVAPTPSDRAFALFYLVNSTSTPATRTARSARYPQALAASPTDVPALAGKAKAESRASVSTSQPSTILAVVSRAPSRASCTIRCLPIESIGRTARRNRSSDRRDNASALRSNGVEPDAAMTCSPSSGTAGGSVVQRRARHRDSTVLLMRDAYAWALHANGRDREALAEVHKALELVRFRGLTSITTPGLSPVPGNADVP